ALFNWLGETAYFNQLIGFLLKAKDPLDLLGLILTRGGNRFIRAIVSYQAFVQHPWTGIGFGADEFYTTSTPGTTLAQRYFAPWISYRGSPFLNPYLEAAGTMGLAGLAAMIALTIDALRRFVVLLRAPGKDALLAQAVFIGFFSMF